MQPLQAPHHAAPRPDAHAHEADLEACLDLLNTLHFDDGVAGEHLASAEDAIGWFAERGLAHEELLRQQARTESEAWLERIRASRDALREVWDAAVEQRAPASPALDTVNGLLDLAPRTALRASANGLEVTHRHAEDDPTGEVLAGLALSLVQAIAAGRTGRFRICANDGCRWAFEDASRAGRRRWCDMSTCGNRAKARRFRSRHRTDAPGTGSDGQAARDQGVDRGEPAVPGGTAG